MSRWCASLTWRLNIPARRILRGSEEIHLTPIEFRLLAALLNNPGKVLTQRQLLNQVWGPNAVEHSHYLRIYMGHLRQSWRPIRHGRSIC
ncbi:DNA-binding response regulator KdpE [Klebsiella pneumoniae]|uniref:DNA-binding response regulator KdpE n=1 Tax=Klebsiella pneumoniae TaxID=573 RepID=A0A377W4J9_KLEPN|nr:DNA-binding response regulator KdpE [Klebsiella pneumoniae]